MLIIEALGRLSAEGTTMSGPNIEHTLVATTCYLIPAACTTIIAVLLHYSGIRNAMLTIITEALNDRRVCECAEVGRPIVTRVNTVWEPIYK